MRCREIGKAVNSSLIAAGTAGQYAILTGDLKCKTQCRAHRRNARNRLPQRPRRKAASPVAPGSIGTTPVDRRHPPKPQATLKPSGSQTVGTLKPPSGYPEATLRLPPLAGRPDSPVDRRRAAATRPHRTTPPVRNRVTNAPRPKANRQPPKTVVILSYNCRRHSWQISVATCRKR